MQYSTRTCLYSITPARLVCNDRTSEGRLVQYLIVKNWRDFQHYKKRSPPWIKLHRHITEDYAFAALKDACKAHLMLIWVLAAGSEGRIPNDPKFVAKRINAAESVDLDAMIAAGFLLPDGEPQEQPSAAQSGNGSAERAERKAAARRVLTYLNEQTGRNYHAVDANLDPICARLEEYDEQTLRGVIVDRCDAWKADEKMAEYLRPATLFNKTKCSQYVGNLPK